MQKHYKKSLKTQGFLNPERFVYFSGETPSPPETTPQEEEKPKEKPKALTDAQKRNATRSQAKRVAGLLRKLPADDSKDLAIMIDNQYEKSRQAEIALNLDDAITQTNELRSLLVRGQIMLSAHDQPDQSAASQYWDRELGLDKERASEAKKKAEDEEVERRAAIELPGLGDDDRLTLARTREQLQREQEMMARVEQERNKSSDSSSSTRTETAAAPSTDAVENTNEIVSGPESQKQATLNLIATKINDALTHFANMRFGDRKTPLVLEKIVSDYLNDIRLTQEQKSHLQNYNKLILTRNNWDCRVIYNGNSFDVRVAR